MTWIHPARTERGSRSRRRVRQARERLGRAELLEPRLMLAVRAWVSDQSGDWEDASNWADDMIPTAADTAQINVAGIDININSDVVIEGIDSNARISLLTGSLTLTGDGSLSGGLTVNPDLAITAQGRRNGTCGRGSNGRRRRQVVRVGRCHYQPARGN